MLDAKGFDRVHQTGVRRHGMIKLVGLDLKLRAERLALRALHERPGRREGDERGEA